MRDDVHEILHRSAAVMGDNRFGPICRATAEEYRAVSDRILAAKIAAGATWNGIKSFTSSPAYAAVARAAWARRTRAEIAVAYNGLRERTMSVDEALARLREWVPEAEACRPAPARDIKGLNRGGRPASAPGRPTRSKRRHIRDLPQDWIAVLWRAAVVRRWRHLSALGVLCATGCRPIEICRGVAVRALPGAVEVCISGAKARDDIGEGQPWRRLTVALDDGGPLAHLHALAAAAPGEVARIRAKCSPNALSMGIASLGEDCLPGHRLSAYDLRHQRCADSRIAFHGDRERVAAFMGHASTVTASHYARLPRSSDIRGARPISAEAPRPVRHPVSRTAPEPVAAAAP